MSLWKVTDWWLSCPAVTLLDTVVANATANAAVARTICLCLIRPPRIPPHILFLDPSCCQIRIRLHDETLEPGRRFHVLSSSVPESQPLVLIPIAIAIPIVFYRVFLSRLKTMLERV